LIGRVGLGQEREEKEEKRKKVTIDSFRLKGGRLAGFEPTLLLCGAVVCQKRKRKKGRRKKGGEHQTTERSSGREREQLRYISFLYSNFGGASEPCSNKKGGERRRKEHAIEPLSRSL